MISTRAFEIFQQVGRGVEALPISLDLQGDLWDCTNLSQNPLEL